MDIDKLIKIATLNKAGASKEVYRAIKAELLLNNSSKNPKPEGKTINSITLSEDGENLFNVEINELELSIIKKLIKEKEEQISMYEANSRNDLASMYREQRDILKVFLPEEISKDKIEELVTTSYPNGYTQKEIGKVIKEVKITYPTADGKLIAEVVKAHIQ